MFLETNLDVRVIKIRQAFIVFTFLFDRVEAMKLLGIEEEMN